MKILQPSHLSRPVNSSPSSFDASSAKKVIRETTWRPNFKNCLLVLVGERHQVLDEVSIYKQRAELIALAIKAHPDKTPDEIKNVIWDAPDEKVSDMLFHYRNRA